MDITKQLLERLKTEAKQYGFSESELQAYAEGIAAGVQIKDDADDATVAAAVDAAVKGALPMLRLTQSAVTRQVALARSAWEKQQQTTTKPEPPKQHDPNQKDDDALARITAMLEAQAKEISDLKANRVAQDRKGQLQKALDGTGAFGEREMKNFQRMTFKDDAEFDAYMSEVNESLAAYNKERSDAGLSALGSRPLTPTPPSESVMTDAEAEHLAELLV